MDFVTPIGRLVQGGFTLEPKVDMKGAPVMDDKTGLQVKENFIALAIPKTDPGVNALYAILFAQAKAEFPHLFNAAGQCTNPKFAFKVQDGDGYDTNGKSVADKPGFAGNWIFKFATRYLPKCYYEGKFDPTQQIQNPQDIIKRGYFIRIMGTCRGNGVTPQSPGNAVPGLFLSPNLVSFVAFGEEIVGGADAAREFGAAPIGALPPGASAMPVGAASGAPAGLTAPPMPGAAAAPPMPGTPPVTAAPPMPGMTAAPPMPGMTAAPPPAAPVYTMTALAQGATREAMIGVGWTDEAMLAQGYMIKS